MQKNHLQFIDYLKKHAEFLESMESIHDKVMIADDTYYKFNWQKTLNLLEKKVN
jgi:hypothetical protein